MNDSLKDIIAEALRTSPFDSESWSLEVREGLALCIIEQVQEAGYQFYEYNTNLGGKDMIKGRTMKDIKERLQALEISRYYLFFNDGTWRTCIDDQWKIEQLWKRKDLVSSMWVGGPGIIKVIEVLLKLEVEDAEPFPGG